MRRLMQNRLGLLLLALGGAALMTVFLTVQWGSDHPGVKASIAEVAPALTEQSGRIASSPYSPDDQIARNSVRSSTKESAAPSPLIQGMVDDNPYAVAIKLREKGGPGAFAQSSKIVQICRRSLGAISDAQDQKFADALRRALEENPLYAEQLAKFQSTYAIALQQLESRCRPLGTELMIELPRDDDKDGLGYAEAHRGLRGFKSYPFSSLESLADQGQLHSAAYILRALLFYEGRRISDPEEVRIFQRAINLAEFAATSSFEQQDRDLRVLLACVESGVCDGTFEAVELREFPPESEQRKKAKEMAKKIEMAFFNNDISVFLVKK